MSRSSCELFYDERMYFQCKVHFHPRAYIKILAKGHFCSFVFIRSLEGGPHSYERDNVVHRQHMFGTEVLVNYQFVNVFLNLILPFIAEYRFFYAFTSEKVSEFRGLHFVK